MHSMYVLLALLLLSVLVLAHEAGHYFAARATGIEVQEFSVGMGPLIKQWEGKRDTKFSIRALPLGGYCMFYSDEPDEYGRIKTDPRALSRTSVFARIFMTASGPLMNFIVAFAAVVVYLSLIGAPAVINEVELVEEPAALAGLMAGDEILTVNGAEVEDAAQIQQAIAASEGNDVALTVDRDGSEVALTLTPFYDEEAGRYRVGFTFGTGRMRLGIGQTIPFAADYCVQMVRSLLDVLRNMIFRGEGLDQVTGPVGTVDVISQVVKTNGADVIVDLLAMISVNLGVFNLLPIPGLDGCKLIFLAIEAVRRKPVSEKIEGGIHMAGYALLFGLMIMFTYQDILRMVR